MARYRRNYRYSRPRVKRNTIWQPYETRIKTGALADNSTGFFDLGTIVPGVQSDADSAVQPFDNEVIMERVRGHCGHRGESTGATQPSKPSLICPVIVGVKLPAHLNKSLSLEDLGDPYYNLDGEDFPIYMSHVCDVDHDPQPEIDPVDIKAKRKFDVGDVLRLYGRYFNGTGQTTSLELALNLRFLWKLR